MSFKCWPPPKKTRFGGGVVFLKYFFWYFSDVHHILQRLHARQKTHSEGKIRFISPKEKISSNLKKYFSQNPSDFWILRSWDLGVLASQTRFSYWVTVLGLNFFLRIAWPWLKVRWMKLIQKNVLSTPNTSITPIENVLDKFEVNVFHHKKEKKYAQNDLTLHF